MSTHFFPSLEEDIWEGRYINHTIFRSLNFTRTKFGHLNLFFPSPMNNKETQDIIVLLQILDFGEVQYFFLASLFNLKYLDIHFPCKMKAFTWTVVLDKINTDFWKWGGFTRLAISLNWGKESYFVFLIFSWDMKRLFAFESSGGPWVELKICCWCT